MKLAILYFPNEYPELFKKGILRLLVAKMCGLSHERRNPRSESYMRDLALAELGQSARVIHLAEITREDIASADEILLLWPDGNGYGWFSTELKLVGIARRKGIPVRILNGRRRTFHINGIISLIPYWIRRNLERFWICEAMLIFLFLISTPFLLVWDYSRGRR